MLYPLTAGILGIISSTGIGVSPSLQCAVDIGDALIGQCRDQLGKGRAADGIEGNTRALAVRDAQSPRRPYLAPGLQ